MTILAARPAMGKTAMALNIALHLAYRGFVVAMFSMEMSKEMRYLRLIASDARIDLSRLITGTLSKVEWARAIHAHDKLLKSKLLVDATSNMTPRMIETALKKATRKHGKVDMIIVDYLQLMSSSSKKENRQQEVTEISRQLRELARRNDAHMLALSQLSRAPEGRAANGHRPQSSDLRESGSIEQDADIVAMLYREEVYNPDAVKGSAEMILTKSRNSAMDTIPLFYMKNHTKFENVFMS
jgi:replicative DNA helicase